MCDIGPMRTLTATTRSALLAGGHRLDLADEVRQQRALVHQPCSPDSSRRIDSATSAAAARTASESGAPVSKLPPSIP